MNSNKNNNDKQISRWKCCGKFLHSKTTLGNNLVTVGGGVFILLLFLIAGAIPYWEQQFRYFNTAEAGVLSCVEYDEGENTITINCSASFLDVVRTISDPNVLENLGNGEYILNANLEVADGITFAMTSAGDGLQYLKLAGENGIIVYGKILIDGIKITSWDIAEEDVTLQDINGANPRGYVQFAGSEGSQILNSEFGYLGYQDFGRRGFDLFEGEGGPSYDMVVRGSKFHHMWFAFYSSGAYNITIDGNEYYDNIKYALDPHTGTHNMTITNNYVHHNPLGIICSLDCFNILIEGNRVEHNINYGIFFSRNMHDSVARNNHVYNSTTGITLAESPNNQIYNNRIEGATLRGIRLFNPPLADDGLTVDNLVYNNTIINSENGIEATRSHDNILENNIFSNIESSEYRLSGDSSIIIRGQNFDNTLISQAGSATDNHVEIVNSGIIEVREGAIDEGESEEEGGEVNLYNTDIEPYSRTLSNDDDITVNSSS
ncbi:MAG: right-handed parallel beta-helix repeat-containing protein [Thermoproteota archaeon]|nr:right-handed parallel beta-helix repeat-containing protein [Thermoproteota archaeon]